VYEPAAWALHHESALRGRLDAKNAAWLKASAQRHQEKQGGRDHSRFQPALTA